MMHHWTSDLIGVKQFVQEFGELFEEEKKMINDPKHQKILDLTEEEKQVLSTKEIYIPSVWETTDNKINEILRETKEYDEVAARSSPRALQEKAEIDLSQVQTEEDLDEVIRTSCLLSGTEEGMDENRKMIPKSENNFLTDRMKPNPQLEKKIGPGTCLLQVAFYHSDTNTKTQEFIVLGTNFLTDLRRSLYCLSDHILDGESTKSGYFFINDTFYVDTSDPNNLDYSKQVLRWVKNQPEHSPYHKLNLPVKKMEETTFLDLEVKLNERYLYCHQGNCMHYLIFRDLRLFDRVEDLSNEYCYPLRIFQCKQKRRKCSACDIYSARWVTYNDKHTPYEPTFYCELCLKHFHYDENNNLLTSDPNFEVYRYHHE